jgi:diguanylate cyclase (GGDEF)-like protein
VITTTDPTSPQRNHKLLIIDDEPQTHALVKARLLGERIDVFSAADGTSGFDLAQRIQPDLILLDDQLLSAPDGFEVCRQLKDDPATWGIQVIFLTSPDTTGEHKARGLELGAVDYIVKPFDPAELRGRVRASLRTKALLDLLATRSMLDGLTGLWNRAYFQRRLESEMARVHRRLGPLSIILIDVDHFKSINDQHGHPFGDQVLQQVAGVLSAGCRHEDAACRWGGEEFAIIAANAGVADAAALAERLRAQVQSLGLFTATAARVVVTCSFGVAEADGCLPSDSGMANVVQSADRALYHAKRDGRNCVKIAAADCAIGGPTPGGSAG